MEQNTLQVRMLGGFSLRCNEKEVADNDTRSRKVWLLLAYMIYCRTRPISLEDLVTLLWGEEVEGSSNPANALKTMFHRVRSILNQLDGSAGHTLIVRQNGAYAWNTEVPFTFDVEDFEALCRAGAAASGEEERLAHYEKALELYQGDFLHRLSAEPWVVPIAAYFHNLYVQTALDTMPLLEKRSRLEDAVALGRKAVKLEPYCEELYRRLLEDLLKLGDHQSVIRIYEDMRQMLSDSFGIMPSDELQALYREAARSVNDHAVSADTVMEQLREEDSLPGALLCDYDFFKIIYRAEARAVARSGDAVHIALLSFTGEDQGELAKRSLDLCMEHLQAIIRTNLRKGDIAAQCSVSQYVLMLPQANYENSCMVCDRIIRAFVRQYPHSPGRLHFAVQPLEPNI